MRIALQEAITAATEQRNTPVAFTQDAVTVSPGSPIAGDERFPQADFTIITGSTPSVSDLEASVSAVATAAEAVSVAQHDWATVTLTTTLQASRDLFAASEGKVTDTGQRDIFGQMIEAGQPVLDDAANQPTSELTTLIDSLNAFSVLIANDQTAWQTAEDARVAEVERARVVAEQQAAQQQSRSTSGSGSTSSGTKPSGGSGSTGGGTKSSGSGSGSSGGGSSAPAPAAPAPPASGGGSTYTPPAGPALRECMYYTDATGPATVTYVTPAQCAALKANGFNS